MAHNAIRYLDKLDYFFVKAVPTEVVNTASGLAKAAGKFVPILNRNISGHTLEKWFEFTKRHGNVGQSFRTETRHYSLAFAPLGQLQDSWILFNRTLNSLLASATSTNQTSRTIADAVMNKAKEKIPGKDDVDYNGIKLAVLTHLDKTSTSKNQGMSKLDFGINVANVAFKLFGEWAIRGYVAHKLMGIPFKDSFQLFGTIAGVYAWTVLLTAAKDKETPLPKSPRSSSSESPSAAPKWVVQLSARTCASYYLASSVIGGSFNYSLIATAAGVFLWHFLPATIGGQTPKSLVQPEKMIDDALEKHLKTRAAEIFNGADDSQITAFGNSLGRLKFSTSSASPRTRFQDPPEPTATKPERRSDKPEEKKEKLSKRAQELQAEVADREGERNEFTRGSGEYLLASANVYLTRGKFYGACDNLPLQFENEKKAVDTFVKYLRIQGKTQEEVKTKLRERIQKIQARIEESEDADLTIHLEELKAHVESLLPNKKPEKKEKTSAAALAAKPSSKPAASSGDTSKSAKKEKNVLSLEDEKETVSGSDSEHENKGSGNESEG